jgi:hypothetical protein
MRACPFTQMNQIILAEMGMSTVRWGLSPNGLRTAHRWHSHSTPARSVSVWRLELVRLGRHNDDPVVDPTSCGCAGVRHNSVRRQLQGSGNELEFSALHGLRPPAGA